jgi:hypothetical protein
MTSFDVASLFIRVSIREILNLPSGHFEGDIMRLFYHVLTSSFSSFNSHFYKHTLAMGSPLSPVIANCFV